MLASPRPAITGELTHVIAWRLARDTAWRRRARPARLAIKSREAARTFRPFSEDQLSGLLAKTAPAAQKGEFELFKTSTRFDGTANNPQWMG